MPNRDTLLAAARTRAEDPAFRDRLARMIACRTDATAPGVASEADSFLALVTGWLTEAGFTCRQSEVESGRFLIATRIEGPDRPTLLSYSHGDTVPGMAGRWRENRDPWTLTEDGERWYGRGIADNKGQFLVNLTAIEAVLAERGNLGVNLHWIIEMGEEIGSPGLDALCRSERNTLKADMLLASDGPRIAADRPTLFLGARGGVTFRLHLKRREGGRHSGNFGGALRNPALELAHALASITDRNGALRIVEWTPGRVPDAARRALAGLTPAGGEIDADWGALGLTPAERIHAWSSAEILAFTAGDPGHPVNAIPPEATAWLQLRYVAGTPEAGIAEALRAHLDAHGHPDVTITTDGPAFRASQTPADHPAALFAAASVARTTGQPPVVLPSLGGSLPNDIFTDILGLPTIWVPHSYPGCSQHAPDEHLPKAIFPDATAVMAGLIWDIGWAERHDLLG